MTKRWVLVAAATAALLVAAANADTYPSRPVTIIVPFTAGSGTDTIARVLGQPLGVALNQSIVVDDRAGANGAIAATAVARATPDGYTLFLATNTAMSANPSLMKNLSYDPVKDFAPISRIGSYTNVLVIAPDIPAKSLAEFIAYAKANPGKLTFASGNSTGIVAGETFKRVAGLDILHVPYKSTPAAINDVLAGRISMMFVDLTTALPHINSKGVRALVATTRERSPLLPDLPAMREAGLPDFNIDSWCGLFAPAATSKDIVTRLNADVRKIVDGPEVKARLTATGFVAFSSSPEELGAFVKSELVSWGRLIKDAGIEPQ
jgi:tripartite-type tricarboxylate transporter receptor subunit TctC